MRSSRRRFRARLDTDNRRWVLFLLAAATLTEFSVAFRARLSSRDSGLAVLLVVLVFLALIPFAGTVYLLLHSQFLYWTGRGLGGQATARDLHAAQAWSALPLAACSPLAVLSLLLFCAQATSPVPDPGIEHLLASTDPFVRLVVALVSIWSTARYVIYLSEAQRFSKRRAVMNAIAGGVAILGVVACPFIVARLFT